MATDIGVGDSEIASLTVAPADTDTVATLTVRSPAGDTVVATSGGDLTPIGDAGDLQQQWTSDDPVTYTLPGRWVLHWDVVGTGEGAEDFEVFVSAAPVPGGPVWAPGLSRVADYVPRLTVDTVTPGEAVELGTFTAATLPTDRIAQRHIDNAVAGVAATVPTVPVPLQPLAQTVAALRAAASIQRSYSNTALGLDTLSISAALDARADAEMARLQTAVDDLADGETGSDDFFDVVPLWSSPSPFPFHY